MTNLIYWMHEGDLPYGHLLETEPTTETTGLTGFAVAKEIVSKSAHMAAQIKMPRTNFTVSDKPSQHPNGLDGYAVRAPLNGEFASGDWTISFRVIAKAAGGSQDGRMRVKVWQVPDLYDPNYVGAVEMTSGSVALSTVNNLSTSTAQTVSGQVPVTQNLVLSGAYVVVQCAWEITGAGGKVDCDVMMRTAPDSKVVTTDFTAAP